MNSPTKKVTTPQAKVEIEIKDWINGQDAEYIDEALMAGVKIKPDMGHKTATVSDFNTAVINEQAHREIEKFVVSVNGVTENILKTILDLPEDDYNFVKDEIGTRRTKKKLSE